MKQIRKAMKITMITAVAAIITASQPAMSENRIAPVRQVAEWIAQGALIVDVRTLEEFNGGHYPGAINIPLADIENNIARFGDKKRLIVVYCRSGNRSSKAKALLEKNGFNNVLNGGGLKDMP